MVRNNNKKKKRRRILLLLLNNNNNNKTKNSKNNNNNNKANEISVVAFNISSSPIHPFVSHGLLKSTELLTKQNSQSFNHQQQKQD